MERATRVSMFVTGVVVWVVIILFVIFLWLMFGGRAHAKTIDIPSQSISIGSSVGSGGGSSLNGTSWDSTYHNPTREFVVVKTIWQVSSETQTTLLVAFLISLVATVLILLICRSARSSDLEERLRNESDESERKYRLSMAQAGYEQVVYPGSNEWFWKKHDEIDL